MVREDQGEFPFGRLGVYCAMFFWLILGMAGARGSGWIVSFLTLALFLGALVCGAIGLVKPGVRNKVNAGVALVLILFPFLLMG